MGGFGALATAGAGYDSRSPIHRTLPPGALADQSGPRSADPRLRAVVAFAPWGAGPPHRAWSDPSLAGLRPNLLLIAGDQDDISGFEEEARWLFDHAGAADRRLLVYKNARHNVAGNPSPFGTRGNRLALDFFDEPVWRSDRLNAIGQHFVTAFFDRHLKDAKSRDLYLGAPTGSPPTWPGFRPRPSLGFELHYAPPR